jgi:decaprenylphospho-beta-D-erythro-pentofuranosid-2-ulose 2-reductase
MSYVLIVGAKSDIAKELAKIYAKNGYNLYLAAREPESLIPLATDIKIRFDIDVKAIELDITNYDSHVKFYSNLVPKPEGVIIVSGYMSEQKLCEKEWAKTLNTIEVNYTGAVSFLNIVANDMEKTKNGFIVGVSSVAGERGRKANYIYGSSKAAFTTYLSGLRNRMYSSNVNVLTVKPGFVATKMTAGLDLPQKLTSKPKEVAKNIYFAQQKKKNVLYTKSIWFVIMIIVKFIPEWKFKSMNI